MTKFLTVKEAAKLTGKSPSSVRRIIYPILEDESHPDRHYIEPDIATARALRLKGENFAWKISEELLRREVPEGESKSKGDSRSGSMVDDQSAAIIGILRGQLGIKDQQIAAQNEVIKGLTERVREGNVLMGSLQQQLAPPDTSKRNFAVVEDARPTSAAEKGSVASTNTEKKERWWNKKLF